MLNREVAACYRLYAANCVELAEHLADLDRRLFLLAMARDWLRLADQAEKKYPHNDAATSAAPQHPSADPQPQAPAD